LTSPKRSAALECDEGTRNILEKLKSKIIWTLKKITPGASGSFQEVWSMRNLSRMLLSTNILGYGMDDRGGRSSSSGKVNNFLFSTRSRPVLGPTQAPTQLPGRYFSRGKEVGAWIWPLTSNYCQDPGNVDLYIHSPIRLHGCSPWLVKHRDNFTSPYRRFVH
jgi:hypothetical protein